MSDGRARYPGGPILLICIPGTLCNGWAFEGLTRELGSRGYPVRSKIVNTGSLPTARETAQSAVGQIDLAPGERLFIAGFSLGGIIAVQLATLCAKDLAGLVLMDMNGEADRPENAVNRRAAVARAKDLGLRNFILQETWPTHVAAEKLSDASLREEVVRMAEECGIDAFANQVEIAISRPRTIDLLPSITAPVLVLCGEEDRITPPTMSQTIAAALPKARLEVVRGVGHFAIFEKPDVIADIVGTWISGSAVS